MSNHAPPPVSMRVAPLLERVFTTKVSLKNGCSTTTLFFIVTPDPNATKITSLGAGAGLNGGNFNFVAEKNKTVVSVFTMPPGKEMEYKNEKRVFLTVARKKQSGGYSLIRYNRPLESGEIWTANDQILKEETHVVKELFF